MQTGRGGHATTTRTVGTKAIPRNRGNVRRRQDLTAQVLQGQSLFGVANGEIAGRGHETGVGLFVLLLLRAGRAAKGRSLVVVRDILQQATVVVVVEMMRSVVATLLPGG